MFNNFKIGSKSCALMVETGQNREPSRDEIYHMGLATYRDLYSKSIENPEEFWEKHSEIIYWHRKWDRVLDDSKAPFYKWFVNGKTNMC